MLYVTIYNDVFILYECYVNGVSQHETLHDLDFLLVDSLYESVSVILREPMHLNLY